MIDDRVLDLRVAIALDLSQAELRLLAEVSGDKLLIEQFRTGKDIHCLVGHMLTGFSLERIKAEKTLRTAIKQLHFGIIYGKGREHIYEYIVSKIREIDGENANLTGITPKKMMALYDKYFETYEGVRRFVEAMRRQVETVGYVETLFGFKMEIKIEGDSERGSYWGNQCINRPIQSSAHQFVLIVMALLNLKQSTYKLLQESVMEVHDALYFFVKLRDLPEAYTLAKHLFEKASVEYAEKNFKLKIRVPLIAEGSAGFCLGSMVDYEGELVEEFLHKWRAKHKKVESMSWREALLK